MSSKRATNFTKSEEDLLIRLVLTEKNILENKKTDAITAKKKAATWEKVAYKFNASSENPNRTAKILKEKYTNIKRLVRRRRVEVYKNIFLNEDKLPPAESTEEVSPVFLTRNNGIDTSVDELSARIDDNAMVDEQHSDADTEFLKKQILEEQLQHARLEHEQKMRQTEIQIMQSKELHEMQMKILKMELKIKTSQLP
ncbi:myb/SANT-like DNA-binding domain-containing protein 4 [Teleopsis dalmanni]|uniref:myb/SANT-like DNA-binding domain-containing protein 4 n=1 Tax=Teleopsis dalmanni TaxID=139649 RepID=UPI0018CF8502|nr:myb/SANT-like DNA-binding domain-containing protein 4 [Teleopsis dalmanni]